MRSLVLVVGLLCTIVIPSISWWASYARTDFFIVDPILDVNGFIHPYFRPNLEPFVFVPFADLVFADLAFADLQGD